MKRPLEQKLKIVTELGDDKQPLLEERTIARLVEVLCHRADRLVADRAIRERLRPAFGEFVQNVVAYFQDAGELDEYLLTNIMTALVTADSHRGVEDYSTFIRRLNPADPDEDRYFVIGRAGRIDDPGCPLREMEQNSAELSNLPTEQLHMYHAFHYARSKDTTRDAPRIPVQDLRRLVPRAIIGQSALEQAFLDVCFSDGAWELYQLKLAA